MLSGWDWNVHRPAGARNALGGGPACGFEMWLERESTESRLPYAFLAPDHVITSPPERRTPTSIVGEYMIELVAWNNTHSYDR